jgi:hypothetical protein
MVTLNINAQPQCEPWDGLVDAGTVHIIYMRLARDSIAS